MSSLFRSLYYALVALNAIASARAGFDQFQEKTVWVDVHYSGEENGSFEKPFNTLAEATAVVGERGAVKFKSKENGKDTSVLLGAGQGSAVSSNLFAARNIATGIGEQPVIANHMDQADIENGNVSFVDIFDQGQALFRARFNKLDGQGRPATTGGGAPRNPDEPEFIRTSAPDSNACFSCHNQPGAGGSGDFTVNVFVLAQVLDPVTFSVDTMFSNERNTVGMNGSGAIEMLAREMTVELHAIRDEATATAAGTSITQARDLVAKGVSFGRITVMPDGKIDPSEIEGIDWDLIIKPFHQKGAVVSLREFTNNAMNHHHGMQSVERFGQDTDPDMDGMMNELTVGDVTALSIFQAALNVPGRVMPEDPGRAAAAVTGESLFNAIGCNRCHNPSLELDSAIFNEPNPYNPAGNLQAGDVTGPIVFDLTNTGPLPRLESNGSGGAFVRVFTDLKRWDLNDAEYDHFANEQLPQGNLYGFAVAADFTMVAPPRPTREFLTGRLWNVGNSGPYGHRGDLTTITEAIHFHGGDARMERDAFFALLQGDQDSIIEFLKMLQVLPETGLSSSRADPSWREYLN
jgi:hypothetical protein